ncbi:ATP-binding protein [Magnetofaba australis]|uniref:histidine kinase n=1 Tax=Magnetofaba australis IT-1 TaxID=1434232 RepID=A0A1Y2K4E7_9PROT|nr:ATP-binding protein [Magnetofaba australis]OSM04136.1 putative sensor signal transduction histidine kinase [Magnetofaba australis IT-1]
MKWLPWPRSLAGQLVWILFGGVTLALISSAAIHLYDRKEAMVTMGGIQAAQRFASIVHVLDPLAPAERLKIVGILNTPLQFVRFSNDADPTRDHAQINAHAAHLKSLMQRYLETRYPLQIQMVSQPAALRGGRGAQSGEPALHPMMEGMMMGNHAPAMGMLHPMSASQFSYMARTRLSDGTWLEYHNHLPEEAFVWPWHLLWSLLILIAVVTALSFLAVRLVTRPLARLAGAARALGHDLRGAPIEKSGSREVRAVIQAFNAMQARIIQQIQERSAMLAAISHDLHTPLTRMRLRVEMLNDDSTRGALLANLAEMEGMTASAMDFIQGAEGMEEVRLADIPSLLEGLEENWRELGHDVAVEYGEMEPFPLMQRSFRRAISNLIQNAVKYGQRARLKATMHRDRLRIAVSDDGPGILEAEMESVLRPFKRLDASRNSKTGGSGLGLSIADSIIRAHGGALHLRNRPEGGLEVIVTIAKSDFLAEPDQHIR